MEIVRLFAESALTADLYPSAYPRTPETETPVLDRSFQPRAQPLSASLRSSHGPADVNPGCTTLNIKLDISIRWRSIDRFDLNRHKLGRCRCNRKLGIDRKLLHPAAHKIGIHSMRLRHSRNRNSRLAAHRNQVSLEFNRNFPIGRNF